MVGNLRCKPALENRVLAKIHRTVKKPPPPTGRDTKNRVQARSMRGPVRPMPLPAPKARR
jgi:hypothetical protein